MIHSPEQLILDDILPERAQHPYFQNTSSHLNYGHHYKPAETQTLVQDSVDDNTFLLNETHVANSTYHVYGADSSMYSRLGYTPQQRVNYLLVYLQVKYHEFYGSYCLTHDPLSLHRLVQ